MANYSYTRYNKCKHCVREIKRVAVLAGYGEVYADIEENTVCEDAPVHPWGVTQMHRPSVSERVS